MKRFCNLLIILGGLLVLGACKSQPAAQDTAASTTASDVNPAGQSDQVADVTLTDGTHYRGVLVSKTGTQMTFRGANGAQRTFDQQDIRSMRFENSSGAMASNGMSDSGNRMASSGASGSGAPMADHGASVPGNAGGGERASDPPMASASIEIPAGTHITVRTNEAIDSRTARAGQTFSAEIARDVIDGSGNVAIPARSDAQLVVRQANASKMGANDLVLDMASVSVNGQRYRVDTANLYRKGRAGVGANKRTGAFVGGTAALGAIIGAVAGGGKGAAIGAVSGAGAGTAGEVLTRGSVKVPAESILTFRLDAPLRLEQ